MSRQSWLLAFALVLLAPLLCSAHLAGAARVEPDDPGAGSTTIAGVSSPGVPSVAKLKIPPGKRIVDAELTWTGNPKNCRPPGRGELEPVAPAFWIGAEQVVAERITGGPHGDIAHANVTERLPGMLAADGSTIAFHGLWQGLGASCGLGWTLHVVWTTGKPAIDIRTEAAPAEGRPGDRLSQTAVITNTGDMPLVGVTADLDSGPCRISIGRLDPGKQKVVSCPGKTPVDGQVAAEARGWSLGGWPVHAAATGRVQLLPQPQAAVSLDIGQIEHIPGTDAAEVPVTVQNKSSSVPLVDVVVTGRPVSCRREIARLEPGEIFSYRCRASAGESVDLTVVGRPLIGGVVAESAQLVQATTHAVVPGAPPDTPPGVAPASPLDAPPAPRYEQTEPSAMRESPEKAAGFIAILGVLVMMVSVGALSSATRAGK
ncbi:hypothetical protein A8926_6478 [Saccharopolyspora spinosa]|uniref:DUF11 domain-containing protein n=1 Tax=Saccharopolyspora spinosa TaxID=60894 RepID=A0A2N3Y674_SACSN|nr:hypothetical protein A8926_6478 [Saccharopolyspora spinosa]